MKALLIIILFLFQSSNIIESNSVDGISIGMEITKFLKIKKDIYQVKEETINLEGDSYPIFNVYKESELIYAVEPDENKNKVWRIWLYGQDFKTKSGIGVGNTLGDLRQKYTIENFETGEGNVAILVKEIEISFLLDTSQIKNEWWNDMSLSKLDDKILIDFIII